MRYFAMRHVALAATALSLVACEEVTEFPTGGVEVRAAHALPAVRTFAIDFTVNVAVDNWSRRVLFVDEQCGWEIERRVGQEWVRAYTADCTPPLLPITEVAPRSTLVFTVTALAVNRVDAAAPLAGTYRVTVPIDASYSRLRNQPVPAEMSVSNAFGVP